MSDMIECKICHRQFQFLSANGHLRKHNLSAEMYLKQFPGAEICTQAYKNMHRNQMLGRDITWSDKISQSRLKNVLLRDQLKNYRLTHPKESQEAHQRTKEANQRPENRQKASVYRLGKKFSDVHKANIRATRQRLISEGKWKTNAFGLGGHRQDIGLFVRSMFEANYVRFLTVIGVPFEYEPKAFLLSYPDGKLHNYRPDFYLPTLNIYRELKGWMSSESELKLRLFQEQYPHEHLDVVMQESEGWKKIDKAFKHEVPHWESYPNYSKLKRLKLMESSL